MESKNSQIKDFAKKIFFENKEFCLKCVSDVVIYPDSNLPDFIHTDFIKVVEYNTRGGKYIRGLTVVELFLIFSPCPNEKELKLASLLGWTIEYLQSLFLILDDIMDNSDTRRGQLCWFRNPEVGLNAINDSFMLKSSIFKLIRIWFKDNPACLDILDLTIDTCVKTCLGQSMDIKLCKLGQKKPPDLTMFNMDTYKKMVEYKTSFYTFVFPFLAAFYLSERKDLNQFIVIFVDTLKNFGLLFQIQDDYLDVFGDSQITGKIGTDIQDGKCTWLTVQLIDLMSDEHKKEFETHFGVNNTDSINLIKDLYIKYDLKELFQNTINKLIIDTIKVIDQISPEPFADYYKKFIQSLQSREK